MEKDDETTATQLHKMLNENGIDISLRTVLRLVVQYYTQYYYMYIKQCTMYVCDGGGEIEYVTIVCRCRTSLGWTFRGSAYCQMIREANKVKRLEWALNNQTDDFNDVIWSDECTIQLENHRRFCCHKLGQAPKPKPK